MLTEREIKDMTETNDLLYDDLDDFARRHTDTEEGFEMRSRLRLLRDHMKSLFHLVDDLQNTIHEMDKKITHGCYGHPCPLCDPDGDTR